MSEKTKVLNFTKKRQENIEEKRRNFERVFFQNFLGAYATVEQSGVIKPVDILDISKDGMLFQSQSSARGPGLAVHDEVTLRLYFTKQSYIPVILKVVRTKNKLIHGDPYNEYGCTFDKSVPTFQAVSHFIDFVYSFAEHSSMDRGDTKVFFL